MKVKKTKLDWDDVLRNQEEELRDFRHAPRVLRNAPPITRLKIARLQMFRDTLGVSFKFWRDCSLWYF